MVLLAVGPTEIEHYERIGWLLERSEMIAVCRRRRREMPRDRKASRIIMGTL